jgi:hypothetical protein
MICNPLRRLRFRSWDSDTFSKLDNLASASLDCERSSSCPSAFERGTFIKDMDRFDIFLVEDLLRFYPCCMNVFVRRIRFRHISALALRSSAHRNAAIPDILEVSVVPEIGSTHWALISAERRLLGLLD